MPSALSRYFIRLHACIIRSAKGTPKAAKEALKANINITGKLPCPKPLPLPVLSPSTLSLLRGFFFFFTLPLAWMLCYSFAGKPMSSLLMHVLLR